MLGVKLPDEIYGYIAENVTANVRQIEGTLNKLLAYRDLLGDQVDEQSVAVPSGICCKRATSTFPRRR